MANSSSDEALIRMSKDGSDFFETSAMHELQDESNMISGTHLTCHAPCVALCSVKSSP
jgi:hypothetical protein